MDKKDANKAAIDKVSVRSQTPVIVQRGYQKVKQVIKPMRNF